MNTTAKRPVTMQIRDKRTKQYNTTTIMVDNTDPRSDSAIIAEFKSNRKQGLIAYRAEQNRLKLTKCNGFLPSSGKLYRSEELDRANIIKAKLADPCDPDNLAHSIKMLLSK